ncbi:ATP-dependent helicase HrpB [Nitritalea halalkaliphila]|uniref:ATP-dependent helicase HrpB n=1 Tax=Nitritalea halalkaliphila TaxID=590849 RepID=UPI0006833FC5|nr:ATP-dependent helicase HrpB [Nitritalea halalkaliphila]
MLDVPGRMYPVDIRYVGDVAPELLPQAAAATALRALREHAGDILIFLPGKAEIEACCSALTTEVNRQEVAIKPLYGMMNWAAQQQTLLPHPGGKRKIVVATSIAETSLTIEGVSIVIDGGRNRQAVYDGQSGLNRLVTVPVSLDAATQRTGRAGRLGPGHCYRLWSKASEMRMQAFRQPEIETADLSALLLLLLDFGVQDPFSLPWLSPPPKKAIYQAWELLEAWEAVKGTRLTPHGRQLLAVPAPPRLAQLLLQARRLGIGALGVDLAALLEEKDPLPQLGSVDLTLRLEAWYRLRSQKRADGLKGFSKLEKIAQQYARHLGVKTATAAPDPYQVGLLLAYAFPERIACQLPQRKGHFQLANGTLAQIPGHDDMAFQSWLAIGEVNPRERVGKVFSAAPLNPADLKDFLRESKRMQWNREEEKVQGHQVLRLGAIELKRTPTADYSDDEVWEVLLPELRKRGKALLNWDEQVMQFILRLYFLRCQEGDTWPDLRPDTLLAGDLDWLRPYLIQVRDLKGLQAIALEQVLSAWLPYEQLEALDRLAPKAIVVPTGAAIPLTYREDGEAPHLRVRLQEMFGQLETPTLLDGKLPLVLELLSPGFKPVQLTKDLRSFWSETYFEVRKELRQRYPKHAWPEDPLQAVPMRGAKPRVQK